MKFTIEHQGKTIDTFEKPNHGEALAEFEQRNLSEHVLRDELLYKVSRETLVECEVWSSLDSLRKRDL